MIRVTIEMLPAGIEELKYKMHIIEIWNDVKTSSRNYNKGSYHYRISRKLTKTEIPSWHKAGHITDFPRSAKNSVHLLLEVLKWAYEE